MNITQEELANKLFISQRTLSNIENGTAALSIMDFLTAFQVLGLQTEDFWIVFLNTTEFEGYLQYKRMRHLLASEDIDELRSIFPSISQNILAKRPLISQFLSFVRVVIDSEMPNDKRLATLYGILEQSIKHFKDKKMSECRLNYNQVLIINELALVYARLGQPGEAIALLDGIVQNIDNLRTTAEENSLLLPKPHIDLAALLVKAGEYEKAAEVCESALELVKEYMIWRCGPEVTYHLGVCYQKMNKHKQEYMPLLAMAYHSAKGIGRHDLADKIGKEHGIA